jgi:hypothetical protein
MMDDSDREDGSNGQSVNVDGCSSIRGGAVVIITVIITAVT